MKYFLIKPKSNVMLDNYVICCGRLKHLFLYLHKTGTVLAWFTEECGAENSKSNM